MTYVKPSSVINLYSDVLITQSENIAFGSPTAQYNYFQKHLLLQNANCSYVKHSKGSLKLMCDTNTAFKANYISWNNPAFESHPIYAKITDWEYLNLSTTIIRFEIDWWQTDMFKANYGMAYIEREHLSEADWAKVEANPWRNDVYELLTEESLPVSKDMLRPLNFSTTTTKPAFGDNFIVLKIASFRSDGTETGVDPVYRSWTDLLTKIADVVIYSTGTIVDKQHMFPDLSGAGANAVNFRTPQACDIVMWKYDLKIAAQVQGKLNSALSFLTYNSLTQEILGMFLIPYFYVSAWLHSVGNFNPTTFPVAKAPDTYVNKKLMRSPYQYLQVCSLTDTKEYQYERFSAHDKYDFQIVGNLDNAPVISVVPQNYWSDSNASLLGNGNLAERLDITDIPAIAYNTDGYLAFLGEQYKSGLSSISTAQVDRAKDTGLGVVQKTMSKFMSTAAEFFKGFASVDSQLSQGEAVKKSEFRDELADFATNTGTFGDVAPSSSVFGPAKRAYACDEYHAGTGNTLPMYVQFNAIAPVYFNQASIRPAILNQYDIYFTEYGYTSNRLGTPRICSYVKGGSEIPHFQLDGDVHYATYIKTSDMKVTGVMESSATYIQNLFNSGVKMLQGEKL